MIHVGSRVLKTSGDYTFDGVVIAVIVKRDGSSIRYIVEDDRGLLLILNAKQLSNYKEDF